MTNGDWTCSEPETVFSSLPHPIPASTLSILTATIARRLTPQAIKLRADIELTCYTPSGIEAIKKALKAGEKQSNDTVPIKAKLVAPPLYVLSTNATDKVLRTMPIIFRDKTDPIQHQFAAVDRLEKAIESIQSTIEDLGGSLVIKMKPKAISESEEQDLAQLMAKAVQENAEVSGDEEEEDEGL
jgi:translation initiation factor 2 subunit 1